MGRMAKTDGGKKGVTLPPDFGAARLRVSRVTDTGIEFRRVADGVPVVAGKTTRVMADPLDYYRHRGVITEDHWTAGERIRRQHYHAFGSGFQSVNLDGFHGGKNYSDNWRISASQGDSLREYIRALSILTVAQREMVESVCCRGEYANKAARRCGVRPRAGVVVLRDTLAILSDYYRTGRRPTLGQ
jgi:Domain of unknown function (DUF6456)